MTPDNYQIKNAIISVSNKTGIVEFAQQLSNLGIIIYSTGGTATLLSSSNIPVRNITDLTNFPEILDGRVKTLHPLVHAGLLADLSNTEHIEILNKFSITTVDLVVVNLYPFEECLTKVSDYNDINSDLLEHIDIGGPTMLRSAAKNHL